jgi:Family of unknown function (DUF6683)
MTKVAGGGAMTRLGLLLVFVVLGAAPSFAQSNYMTPMTNLFIEQSRQNLLLFNNQFNMTMANSMLARNARRAGSPLPRNDSTTATVFAPSSGTIAPQKLAARYGKTVEDRKTLTGIGDRLLQLYESSHKPGVPKHDLAHALAFSLTMSYLVYSDGKARLTEGQSDGVVKILRAFILAYPPFERMSDRDKQEAYETLAILGAFTSVTYDEARKKNDTKLMAGLRSMAQNHIEEILGPLNSIVMTKDGFAYK